MDNVLVDFESGIRRLTNAELSEYADRLDEVPGIFARMEPNPGAVKAFYQLCTSGKFDVYILSTAPWENPSAWSDKVIWVKKYLGLSAHKRLILSHNKHLCKGDIIIDDRTKNGVDKFEGEHIHFGTPKFPDWETVIRYLLPG